MGGADFPEGWLAFASSRTHLVGLADWLKELVTFLKNLSLRRMDIFALEEYPPRAYREEEGVDMDSVTVAGLLQKFSLFGELTPEQLAEVAREAQYQFAARGQILFNRGDSAHGMFLLLDGQVKLAVSSPQGAEKVIGIIGAGESFGEAIIFLDRPFFPISAQTTTDSKLLMIPKHVIFGLLERDSSIALKMLAGLSMRNHQLVQDIESVALLTCSQRLIGYLLQIADASGNSNRITLPTSKTNIASLLNLTPETLSRTMLKLHQSRLIEVHGKEISIINVAGLREFEYGI
ncbi:MAG TPA: Crp/Fnr family transcriptional regulator [Methylophilaceae bacterium]|nr:Crp/Fnr family transcriptional regulator [Methylophilaceae bacterium]